MARLFVVNCTGQVRVVNYRLDFTVDDEGRRTSERMLPYKTITIPPRAQIQFGGDYHPTQISELVRQLEQNCAAHHVDAVRTAKKMGVVKMIWSQDKTVSVPVLRDVISHNINLLTDLGARRRERLALMADVGLGSLLERETPKMELEFEQVEESEDFPHRLTEGVRVRHGGGRGRSRISA